MEVNLLRAHPRTRRFLLGALLNSLGSGLTLPIMVVYLHQVIGLSLSSASIVFSWTAIVGLIASPLVGSLVDHIGPRPMLIAGIVTKTIGVTLWPSMHSTFTVYLFATISAFGDSAMWPPQTTMMARMVPEEDRQRFFGLQFMMLNLGLGAGGMISSFLVDIHDRSSFTRLYMLDAFSYILFLIFILSLRGVGGKLTAEERGSKHAGSWAEVLADKRLMRLTFASILMLVCGYASVDAGVPAMLTTAGGLDVKDLGPVWAVNTSLIVLLQLVVLRRISGHSRTKLLAFVCATWALSWLINGFGVVTHTAVFAMACLSTAVFAIGETVWSPIGAALQNEIAPEHLRGRYNAVGALAWVISGSIGPLISGFMLQRDLVTEWIGMLVTLLALAAVVILRMRTVLTAAEDGILEGH